MDGPTAQSALIGPGAFRLFLAGLVFLSHVSSWKVGTAAVVVFLMLSGYWVSQIYLAGRYAGVGPYLLGRLLRLWPIVIACTSIAAAIQLWLGGRLLGDFWSTIFFLGLATRSNDVIGTTWSLDIELQFYLLLPVILAGLLGAGARWQSTLLAGTIFATIAGILLGKGGLITALAFAPAFAVGIWLQLSQWQPSRRLALFSLAVFLISLMVYVKAVPVSVQYAVKLDVRHFSAGTLLVSLLAVPFVAWNVHMRSSRFDRWLGDLSFPFYLLHFPVIWGLGHLMGDTLVMKVAALVCAIALTILLNRIVDRPFEAWRRRILADGRPPS
jgi:peptidoglycan/LPS O-acetylase OafA/YrhL